ncbi:hypothetical protein [Sporosarcina sp. G11-34]|uniref:hypothetical protein n=1 Tax=Sporosarcina sp. G11-34 TaxID=2849605 RepID=UPI0022A906D7|nr:hypothetical protein [Sporosarcina sp. G11-34]MCZ2257801.1 hypothetical protein [Sporosarcina sp. G11-34]
MRDEVLSTFRRSKIARVSLLIGGAVLLLYIVNRLYLKNVLGWSFIQNHFNDVLAGMLIVAVVNVLAMLGDQRKLLLIRFMRILLFTFVCGLFWEYVTPLYVSYSVSDRFDVLAYMTGGLLYWGIIRIIMRQRKG